MPPNLLRTLIDIMPDFIYVKDAESRFLVANAAVAQVMGAETPDALLGKTDHDFYPPELADRYQADEREVITQGRPLINREEPVRDRAGNLRWVSTTKVPLYDERGKVVGLVGIGRDITERKHVEETLRESEARFRRLAENAQDVIYRYRLIPPRGFEYVNPAVTAIVGYTPEEHYADPDLSLKIVHPDDRWLL